MSAPLEGFTILVDVDDVIYDLVSAWLFLYNCDYDDSLTVEDVYEWDMTKFVKPQCGKRIYDYLEMDALYDDVKPFPGAKDGIEDLRKMGARILFVTANHNNGKLNRLINDGFSQHHWDIVVAADKSKVAGDIIIDDRLQNIEGHSATGILVNRPHNKNLKWGGLRADTWDDIVNAVMEIANTMKVLQLKTFKKLDGVGPETPTWVNESGGKQSMLAYRFDLVDPLAMFTLARILNEGASKYGAWNWRNIGQEDNLNHALSHIYAWMAGDRQDDHLGHAFCRLMFALSQELTPGESERMKPEIKHEN